MLARELEWQRAQEIFADVVDQPAADRRAALDRACDGDDELQAKVGRLLAADEADEDFIEATLRGAAELLGEAVDPVDPILRRGALGKYEILETVGHGGFGKVYSGYDPDLQRLVAIKTCSSIAGTPVGRQLRRRFFREAQIAASLQHPNIITVHDFGSLDDVAFIVQEFLTGEDLDRKISRRAAIPAATRLDYLLQIARGLAHAHDAGVLHRDVKPSNVRVLETDRLKILDFGIARALGDNQQLTCDGLAAGTVGYLAPEQLDGETVDGRADIFSFGVLAYELLSYAHPFPGTFSQISYQLMFARPKPLGEHWPQCPATLAALVERCLEKDKADRYADFHQVIEALTEIAAGGDPLAAAVGPAQLYLAQQRAWGLTAAILLLVATGSWFRSTDGKGLVGATAPSPPGAAATTAAVRRAPQLGPAGGGQAAAPETVEPATPTVEPQPVQAAATAPTQARPITVADSASGGTTAVADSEAKSAAADTPAPPAVEPPASLPADPLPADPLPAAALASPVAASAPTTSAFGGASRATPSVSGPRCPARQAPGQLVVAMATPGQGRGPIEPTPARPATAGGVDYRLRPSAATDRSGPQPRRASLPLRLPSTPHLAAAPVQRLVLEPYLIEQPEARYPSRARRRKQEARVLVAVLVDVDGRVAETKVEKSNDPGLGFEEQALQAALAARFLAGSRNGVAEQMWSRLEFDFRLP